MSTKIFNGFRFLGNDLVEIHQHIMEWRAELRDLHKEAECRFIADMAANMIDEEFLRPGTQSGETPLMKAISHLWERQDAVRKTQRRDPAVDFQFDVSIMPFEGRIYGITFTEQNDWRRMWMAKPFVEEFGYWNNTDAPDDMTNESWEERERIWNSILEPAISSAPSMAGFTAECSHTSVFPDLDCVLEFIPPLELRAARRAKFNVLNARFAHSSDGEPSIGARAISASSWFGSEDGQIAFEAEKSRLSQILPACITREMLIDKL